MRTLAIGLGALLFVACAGEQGDVYDIDAQLTSDGLYGTFVQGDVVVEFSSFEIEDGIYAVTIVGDGFIIDTMVLPPDRLPLPNDVRPKDIVDWDRDGDGDGGGGGDNGGADPGNPPGDLDPFFLPPDRLPVPGDNRPKDLVDYGEDGPGDDDGPNVDIDVRDIDIALRETFPDRPAVGPLLRVLDALK
jgi:hypothetical protein